MNTEELTKEPISAPDKYDRAIAYLTENPNAIHNTWNGPFVYKAGILFRYCTPSTRPLYNNILYGCLTQIKHRGYEAVTPELTAAIRADNRIPNDAEIKASDLPIFAEWQRRIDRELNRPV